MTSETARTSVLICAAAGLATAGGALLDFGWPLYLPGGWNRFAFYIGPGLFGAVFAWRLMKERGLHCLWAGMMVIAVIVAHNVAFKVVVYVISNLDSDVSEETATPAQWILAYVAITSYGTTFAILFAAALAVRFREHLAPGSLALAIALCAAANWAYFPLSEVFPGMFISREAASIAFGLVFAATAGVYGQRLFAAGR